MKAFWSFIGCVSWLIKWFFALMIFVGLIVLLLCAGDFLGFVGILSSHGYNLIEEVTRGIVITFVSGVMFKIFGFFVKGALKKIEYYEAKEKKEKEEEHARLMAIQSLRHSSGGGYGGYSVGPLTACDHDELDATARAGEITRTYGLDWTGYNPEAPGPDPDAYSPPGYDPEAYTGDIY